MAQFAQDFYFVEHQLTGLLVEDFLRNFLHCEGNLLFRTEGLEDIAEASSPEKTRLSGNERFLDRHWLGLHKSFERVFNEGSFFFAEIAVSGLVDDLLEGLDEFLLLEKTGFFLIDVERILVEGNGGVVAQHFIQH